jgi:hypothetical protein
LTSKTVPEYTQENIVGLCLNDYRFFTETFISIKDKKRQIIPFLFNDIQEQFYATYLDLRKKGIRQHIILKPRQLGFTTMICALFLAEAILVPNTVAVIIAHDAESTARIFEITKLMYDNLPDEIRPVSKYSSRREIVFETINSKIFIGTAGSTGFGRGTTINLLHCSEFAFWDKPEEILPSLIQTVPMENGVIIFETTANGYNHFHDSYMEAVRTSEIERKINDVPYPHFYRWFDHAEYKFEIGNEEQAYIQETLTDEEKDFMVVHGTNLQQMAWRRSKQQTLKEKFLQEYPEDDQSCFLSSGKPFFDRDMIKSISLWIEANKVVEWQKVEQEKIKIYKTFDPDPKFRHILCVDPAEGNPTGSSSAAYMLRLHKDPVRIEMCAEIREKIPMPKFWRLLYHLGSLYRYPQLAIERNNHGHLLCYWAVNGLLQDGTKVLDKYPNIYHGTDGKPGFVTNSATRPLILDNLSEVLRNNMLVVYSKIWLDQALSFVYSEKNKPEAEAGKKDDSIIAVAIGTFILINQKQVSSFRFLNADQFPGTGVTLHPQPDNKKTMYDDRLSVYKEQQDTNRNEHIRFLLPDTAELIDYKKFI